MKKQIKNLTKEEAEKICNKSGGCDKCPLNFPSCSYCAKNIILFNKEDLKKEIEVEEE